MATEKNESNKHETMDHGKTVMSWDFPEFVIHKRTTLWYFWAIVITSGLILFALFSQNYLFLIVITLFVMVYILRTKRKPAILTVNITEDGISIGEKTFYTWKQIKKFWIIYEPPEVKNLYIDFDASLRPSITISLENQNPLNVRKLLAQYLEEDIEKENESFSDGFSRMLKL